MKKSLCHTPAAEDTSDINTDKRMIDTPVVVVNILSVCFSMMKAEETVRKMKVNVFVKMKYECHPSSEILY